MHLAGYVLIAGCIVALCCAFRLNCRLMWFAAAWERERKRSQPDFLPDLRDFTNAILLQIKLKDTLVLEIVGAVAGIATMLIAVQFV
jgi:hypothetical protein